MTELERMAEKLAEYLYGHSRAKAIEWAKEDKFESCYWKAEEIIKLLGVDFLLSQADAMAGRIADLKREADKSYREGYEHCKKNVIRQLENI